MVRHATMLQPQESLHDSPNYSHQASQRAGGRIYTVTSKGGLPIELGASWIHGASASNPITQLAKQFGLKTAISSDDQFFLTNGTGKEVTYK